MHATHQRYTTGADTISHTAARQLCTPLCTWLPATATVCHPAAALCPTTIPPLPSPSPLPSYAVTGRRLAARCNGRDAPRGRQRTHRCRNWGCGRQRSRAPMWLTNIQGRVHEGGRRQSESPARARIRKLEQDGTKWGRANGVRATFSFKFLGSAGDATLPLRWRWRRAEIASALVATRFRTPHHTQDGTWWVVRRAGVCAAAAHARVGCFLSSLSSPLLSLARHHRIQPGCAAWRGWAAAGGWRNDRVGAHAWRARSVAAAGGREGCARSWIWWREGR